ncbi:hypothetical protein F2P81_013274 [Scophthalmus maximus]|uniref:Uncharacterized protein n=1 Tax=Scophthalmus maximus TaxID=52904 RepID=A0A6A4SJW5_SCOMX|nr:hypothetical protein F2P81_013274 [Scophthalmus maximus]
MRTTEQLGRADELIVMEGRADGFRWGAREKGPEQRVQEAPAMFTFLFVIIVPDRNEDQNEWIHRANLKSVPQESIIQMHKYCFVPDQLYDMLSSKCDQSERPEATSTNNCTNFIVEDAHYRAEQRLVKGDRLSDGKHPLK